MVNHVVIMAGGAGKRLWPASYSKKPKQFLTIEDKSLIVKTIERAFALSLDGNILIVTHQDWIETCCEEIKDLDEKIRSKVVVLGEPEGRNTAPALALASQYLSLKGFSDDSLLVLAADHIIGPIESFCNDVMKASELTNKNIVTFGIKPDSPETGFGYIEASESIENVADVISFREKPDLETAKEFLKKGNYLWNSGMFAYTSTLFFEQLSVHSPEINTIFTKILMDDFDEVTGNDRVTRVKGKSSLASYYSSSPKISVDYAVMEKSNIIKVVEATFEWNDVGSWDEISSISNGSSAPILGNGMNNFVQSDIPVAIRDVDDIIVVVENGVVMICRKGKSQNVKELVLEAEEKGLKDYL